MGFTEAIKTCFQKYVDFSGRASRSEYWWFFLFTVIARVLTAFIPGVGFIVSLGLLLPSLAATARRLHDTNRTGWWILLPISVGIGGIIAGGILAAIGVGVGVAAAIAILGLFLGFLVLLRFLIQPSDPGANRYGPSPFSPPSGVGGYGYIDPGQPHEPPYDAAPPDAILQPSGRQYCSQCGAERAAAEAQFCTVCGSQF